MNPSLPFRLILHYNPLTGEFTYLYNRGPRRAGSPAGTVFNGRRHLSLDGIVYPAAFIAWAWYNDDPTPQHVTFLDNNPLNLALSNLALSPEPFRRIPKPRGRRAERPAWMKSIRWSQRQGCWKAYHNRRLIDSFTTKADAIEAKRQAMQLQQAND